jgi:tetratricopeptide (TPR) repeat protein
MIRAARLFLLALALSAVVQPAGAQHRSLGSITFPNSGAPEAQDDFALGVLLLHSFEYDDAAAAFRRAQDIDRGFALAYWGEAMTYNHPLWRQQDGDAARAVLARYDGSPTTEREAMYLDAVRVLYGDGPKPERDRRYMEAMRRLHESYPTDSEAQTFYSLSILGLTDGTRDFGNYMRAASIAQPVFEAQPDHPGAAHYIIHSFDDPIHAPLGLPAARAYGAIAPDAGHAQHMTSHIFVAMGMWEDVIRANINATSVQDRGRAARGLEPNRCGHYSSWLAYGYLMTEQWGEAEEAMDHCQASQAQPDPDDRGYYAGMRARQVIDTGDWDAAHRWRFDVSDVPQAQRGYDFTTAYAAIQRGELAVGQQILDALRRQNRDLPRLRIQELELEALLARANGDTARAIQLLTEAASLEEELPFEFGPPASLKPPHELLGEVLLGAGRPIEAVKAFQTSLELTPLRTPSLRGLAVAAEKAGMDALAEETHRAVNRIVR